MITFCNKSHCWIQKRMLIAKKKNFFTRIRSSDQNRTSIYKVTEFLPAFLFATAFKEAYIEKNEKKKHRGAYDLSLVKSEQLKYSRVFITDVLYM